MKTSFECKCARLLDDHGYGLVLDGDSFRLIERAIPGYTSERVIPSLFQTALGAVEHLIPICGAAFSLDYHNLVRDKAKAVNPNAGVKQPYPQGRWGKAGL